MPHFNTHSQIRFTSKIYKDVPLTFYKCPIVCIFIVYTIIHCIKHILILICSVMSIRMMAQFAGHETIYNGMWGSMQEIYQNEGVMGFFA